jgi:hypothetical protein
MKRYSSEWEEEEILPNSYRKQLKEGKKNGK